MAKDAKLLIDFDSTFIKLEGLDELAKLVSSTGGSNSDTIEQIEKLTQLGMEGKISFEESLSRRIKMLEFKQADLAELITLLRANISDSVLRNQSKFLQHAENIYILSGGFEDFIIPIVESFGISSQHVIANKFIFDSRGVCRGYEPDRLTAQSGGKLRAAKELAQTGRITASKTIAVGDGYTDLEIKLGGGADKFIAFSENTSRASVQDQADLVTADFGEVFEYVFG